MDELDSDECLLRHGNYVAKRDIVQVVYFLPQSLIFIILSLFLSVIFTVLFDQLTGFFEYLLSK